MPDKNTPRGFAKIAFDTSDPGGEHSGGDASSCSAACRAEQLTPHCRCRSRPSSQKVEGSNN